MEERKTCVIEKPASTGFALSAPAQRADELFLEGPRSRLDEFITVLSVEQKLNPYLDRCVTTHYFFVRKALLIKYSCAFEVMPGGAGTLDELFEALI